MNINYIAEKRRKRFSDEVNETKMEIEYIFRQIIKPIILQEGFQIIEKFQCFGIHQKSQH